MLLLHCQMSVSVVGNTRRQTNRWAERWRYRQTNIKERRKTLKHGCRASEQGIPKHTQRVDRRQPVRYADKQRSLFGSQKNTDARPADRYLEMQAFCQVGHVERFVILWHTEV